MEQIFLHVVASIKQMEAAVYVNEVDIIYCQLTAPWAAFFIPLINLLALKLSGK